MIHRCGNCGSEHECRSNVVRVIIESPLAGDVERNLAYARACLRDSLDRGEAPYASHLLYPQVYNDSDPDQRLRGIEAGLQWGAIAHATVVYTDLGISSGMEMGIERARRQGRSVVYRSIPNWETLLIDKTP